MMTDAPKYVRWVCMALLAVSFISLVSYSVMEIGGYSSEWTKILLFGLFLVALGTPVIVLSGNSLRQGYKVDDMGKEQAGKQLVVLFDLVIGCFMLALGLALLVAIV